MHHERIEAEGNARFSEDLLDDFLENRRPFFLEAPVAHPEIIVLLYALETELQVDADCLILKIEEQFELLRTGIDERDVADLLFEGFDRLFHRLAAEDSHFAFRVAEVGLSSLNALFAADQCEYRLVRLAHEGFCGFAHGLLLKG